ncbi:TetR/AcrR family transcriptional regulator [Occultella kanbiaonis]|uniref:TetR/AcrR family transcriptional regulator n=1 Tax=Occultella kanbiaonis TaxID=2675754 RepID=UPI0012B928A4|nr:TetR/AcrR family transcriptional regulator [Occultella kanbiaonis]
METEAPKQAAGSRGGPSTRERILAAATELFYANGIRATSADRIIEQVGITKVTFYRHFRTKDDLVVAYLERSAAWERNAISLALEGRTALDSLRAIAMGIGADSCRPGFRGCAFINAAAEFPEAEHPVRIVVEAHRRWTQDVFAGLAVEAGVAESDTVAGQLMMLRDGAMVNGYLSDPESIAQALGAAYLAVVEAGRHPQGA